MRFVCSCLVLLCAATLAVAAPSQDSTDWKEGTDPLAAPEMKKFAPGACELGWKYFEKGDYETALRRFAMSTRHDRTYAPGYFGTAYVYSVQGKLDEAITYYREALKYDQKYPYTFANLGYALLQKDKASEGLLMLDRALQLDPHCGEARLSYAMYFANKGEWTKAGESANQAIECGLKLPPEFRKLLTRHGATLRAEPRQPPASHSH
jgi:Tfp pilus assembly protein PilF